MTVSEGHSVAGDPSKKFISSPYRAPVDLLCRFILFALDLARVLGLTTGFDGFHALSFQNESRNFRLCHELGMTVYEADRR